MSQKMVVYGGSFDPCGLNHVQCAHWIASQPDVSQVVIVPSAFHAEKEGQTSFIHRLRMVELSLGHHRPSADGHLFVVTDIEARMIREGHVGPVYTYDLLTYIRNSLAKLGSKAPKSLQFAIGPDLIPRVDTWHLGPEVREEFGFYELPDFGFPRATELRERIRQGEPWRHMVVPEVAKYIERYGLYGVVRP